MTAPIRRALISVWDKTGVVDFARALHTDFGVELISTGGTAAALRDAGLPVTLVETLTASGEMLDGRVKTLHPGIHATLLADRDKPDHLRQLAQAGIAPIDLVLVNLYPFERTIADPRNTFAQAIEMIDIGGVALLRAAAKNHRHVLVLANAERFEAVLAALRSGDADALAPLRAACAREAFETTHRYDGAIAAWLSRELAEVSGNARKADEPMNAQDADDGAQGADGGAQDADDGGLDADGGEMELRLVEARGLRYGENPHQSGAAMREAQRPLSGLLRADRFSEEVKNTTPMSYNNFLDADAALELCRDLSRASGLGGASLSVGPVSNRPGVGPVSNRPGVGAGFQPAPPGFERLKGERLSRRRLPHIQNPGHSYFVTFRLRAGELSPAERDIVLSACKHWHGDKMTLHRVCVMPDHVHLLFTPHEVSPGNWVSLSEILHSIKRYSAQQVNHQRGASGPLWMSEYFDRIMRDEQEFVETWEYIEANPVTAGLVSQPCEYRWAWSSDTGFQECAEDVGVSRLETGSTPSRQAVCVFIKHSNPCGVGVHEEPGEAYRRAYLGDPNAAMGGVLACSFDVDVEFAALVLETYARFGKPLHDAGASYAPGGFFVEVWIAPSFTPDAIALIRGTYDPKAVPVGGAVIVDPPRKPWGEKVRLLPVADLCDAGADERVYRSIAGGLLSQTPDRLALNEEDWKVVTRRAPREAEMVDLRLAWLACKHARSNAIVLTRGGMLLGAGAGQMSRVMSCRVATWLARDNGHADPNQNAGGIAAASDAFFPFPDGPQTLIDAGVTAIIQPGGGKRDAESIAACDARGVSMIFTGARHFRH